MPSYLRLSMVAALLAGIVVPSQAAFLDTGWGARPVGMGGAFTALSDDANASLFNPAGLAQLQWNQLSANYSQLFSGLTLYSGDDIVHLDQSYLAYASRSYDKIGAFGVSWANFTTTHLYREDTLALSYARYLGDIFPVGDKALSVGFNVKYLHRTLALDSRTSSDPVFANGNTSAAPAVDLGVLYKPEEGALSGLRVGFTAKNLNQPNVGFDAVDRVPIEWRLGLAYQSLQMPWFVPAVDVSRSAGVTGVYGGVESWLFHDSLGVRAGANRDEAAAGLSYYQAVGKKLGFRLDYAFTIPFFIEQTSGSHRVAATMYF